jgi:phage tail sheath protein FI
MPKYLSPGVYIEEIKPTTRSIAGVGTSTAGFIGVVMDDVVMPQQPADGAQTPPLYRLAGAGVATLITSWEEFKKNFGDFQLNPTTTTGDPPISTAKWTTENYEAYLYLQHAVYGFFKNGGSRCWVLRVATKLELDNLDNELNVFAAIDEIAIVAVPGAITQGQHSSILTHCSNLKDRFAILDGVPNPPTLTDGNISPTGRSASGSYGAIYYPWIKVANATGSNMITIPPSGHIAGIYARSDQNYGVFKTPANEEVAGALDVERLLSKADQDGLNPQGINLIRSFNGTIKIWGGRTRADENNSEFRYISTRRFLNYLYESIDESTQFAVFEPNTPVLWQKITQTLTGFLLTEWRNGALFGTTPEQAFFVRCDKDTNPPEIRELGQVVAEVGVAVVKPAEFVIFRIQQTTGG